MVDPVTWVVLMSQVDRALSIGDLCAGSNNPSSTQDATLKPGSKSMTMPSNTTYPLAKPSDNSAKSDSKPYDSVNHPKHYTSHPSGIECIQVTRHFNFNLGNAIKYIWRAGEKDQEKHIEDLRKAAWYLNDEIQRLTGR